MSNKFVEHKGFNLVETNKEVLDKWMADDVFHKSIDEREGCPQFVFFEGPPSANGHPGIHHVLARAIKDTFNRYKTMQGFQVHRKAGWDTHGLPVVYSRVAQADRGDGLLRRPRPSVHHIRQQVY